MSSNAVSFPREWSSETLLDKGEREGGKEGILVHETIVM